MPSSTDRWRKTFDIWNRRGHYYLGLYFLFFLWLFALTGLLLNHSWSFAEFWPNRRVSKWEKPVRIPVEGSDLDRARAILEQIGAHGEIEWTAARADSPVFSFRVTRPGTIQQVTADPRSSRAEIETIEFNAWGIARVLHTFSGVRAGDARNERDWILTSAWAFAMDAVAAGLVLMVLGGIYLWIGLPGKRVAGAAALAAGSVTCGLLAVGLRWIYG